ncbi:MAG: sulfite exporter TauE/SafE family protein [Betaproteobacteria bacterium]|jgi:uncharacterized membrane protein YfcA|nr:sulfite exporter TauE/SafE family protein [Betaproteobacteria bacterium]
MSHELPELAWIAASVFFAFFIRGMSGFGAGMIAVPLLAFVVPLQVAVPLNSLLVFVLFIAMMIRDRSRIDWNELWRLVPPTVIGAVAGLWLFSVLDNRMLVLMLGGFLVLYAIYMLVASFMRLPQLRCSMRWAWPAGVFGGFFDTIFGGGGGTLVVIYVNARGIAREAFRATLAALWFFEMLARISGYAWSGYYTGEVLWLLLLLLPVMGLATLVGERLGNRVDNETFTRLLGVLLLASGLSLLVK